MLPVKHVGADGMSPMHGAPERSVRIVLIEDVVLTPVVDRTVGVIHPVGRGEQVILRPQDIVGQLFAQCVGFGGKQRGMARPGKASQRRREGGVHSGAETRGTRWLEETCAC